MVIPSRDEQRMRLGDLEVRGEEGDALPGSSGKGSPCGSVLWITLVGGCKEAAAVDERDAGTGSNDRATRSPQPHVDEAGRRLAGARACRFGGFGASVTAARRLLPDATAGAGVLGESLCAAIASPR